MNWFKCDENGVTLTALSKMLSTIHDSLDCSISGLLKTGETDLVLKHKDIKDKLVIHASPNPIIKNGYVNLDPNTFATIAKPTTQTTPEPINNPL